MKRRYQYVLEDELHFSHLQWYMWINGQFLWPSYQHEIKTLEKMGVSTFCFLKQVLLFLVLCIVLYVNWKIGINNFTFFLLHMLN